MNKAKKIELLSRRFDKDASDGFATFSDADKYFESIKNPFENKKVSSGSSGSWRFFIAELVAITVMLAGVEFIYTAHDVSVTNKEKTINAASLNSTHDYVLNDYFHEEVKSEKEANAIVKKNVFRQVIPSVSSLDPVKLVESDSVIDITPKVVNDLTFSQPRYEYQNFEKYYALRYVNDLLVIDYSDSFPETKQLRPVLTGTPASFEKSLDRSLEQHDDNLYENVKYDYIKSVTIAIEDYSQKRYQQAQQHFKLMLNKFPKDQNALFYAGLSAFEKGNIKQANNCFVHLLEMDKPLFAQEADFYLAQCYLKSNDVQQAKQLLNKIVHSNSFYKDKAKELLRNLN